MTLCVASHAQVSLREQLAASRFKIAWECYVDGNWEIYVMNADGSQPTNLTRTPLQHEHYPQVSPDGTRLCFSVDDGEGRDAVRSLWIMNLDGTGRIQVADHAREPFWGPSGKILGFLPQEYPKFNVIDYYTKGISFYDLATRRITPHPNSANLHHLYNPSFAPNGKWIVSTVHAGMGYDHAILAIQADGDRIVNLNIPGCRPCLSPDGTQIAWGPGDHEVALAPIDLESDTPTVGPRRRRIQHSTHETYHVDWSPDSRYVSLSLGPASKGDPTKPGTFQSACEIVGVYAAGWDIWAVSAEGEGVVDLERPGATTVLQLTENGLSNKESDWFVPGGPQGGQP
ncbi:MAG: PD40 domain-containing protein [Verrucomicrobiales bacterium]|nr:PD40 domain-containing protein [Verrucomicrobiales bacterium]